MDSIHSYGSVCAISHVNSFYICCHFDVYLYKTHLKLFNKLPPKACIITFSKLVDQMYDPYVHVYQSTKIKEFNPQSRIASYQRRYKNGTSSALV